MKRFALAAATLTLALAAHAQQVSVTDPWVRATVPKQTATGAFMHLKADQDVRLVAGDSPVAGVVEIHEMAMENNVMRMRHLKDGLPLAAGQMVELNPGGYHIMLMDLKAQVKEGQTVPVTLTFENAATKARFTQEVKAPVTALGAGNAAPSAEMHDKHDKH